MKIDKYKACFENDNEFNKYKSMFKSENEFIEILDIIINDISCFVNKNIIDDALKILNKNEN